jgi:hypothetical protein
MRTASALRLPYPPWAWTAFWNTAAFWLALRVASAPMLWKVGGRDAVLHPQWQTRVFLVGTAALIAWMERRRSREHLLQGNLGEVPGWLLACSLLAAAGADAVLQIFLRVS